MRRFQRLQNSLNLDHPETYKPSIRSVNYSLLPGVLTGQNRVVAYSLGQPTTRLLRARDGTILITVFIEHVIRRVKDLQ